MTNHAITGYACFLGCRSLRKSFLQNIRIIIETVRCKKPITHEASPVSHERL